MRDRFLHQEVWERLGDPPARVIVPHFVRSRPRRTCSSSGCCSPRSPRTARARPARRARRVAPPTRFTELGVIEFEDHVDTAEEYTELHVFGLG